MCGEIENIQTKSVCVVAGRALPGSDAYFRTKASDYETV